MPRGLLVTVEGIDGSGKSTFARELAATLVRAGRSVELTAEPTKTWLGESVRRALKGDEPAVVDALLFMADHAAHVPRVKATLAKGVTVVSDRWSDSTFAYQAAALAGEMPRPLAWLRAAEKPFDLRPDVTFLLDIPVPEALARVAGRGGAREKFEAGPFLEKVRRNYRALARAEKRFVVVDARRPVEETGAEAAKVVLRKKAR